MNDDRIQDWFERHPWFAVWSLVAMTFACTALLIYYISIRSIVGALIGLIVVFALLMLLANEAQAERERRGEKLFEDDER